MNGDVKCLIPTGTMETRSSNYRIPELLNAFRSGSSVVSTFLIGLVSGAAGGLLLGATAVVLLQSLELLDGNKLLMEKLQKLVTGTGRHVGPGAGLNSSRGACSGHVNNVGISVFVVEFGVLSSTLALAAGFAARSSVYFLINRNKEAAAAEKAVAVGGAVGLIAVTASGSVLGLTLERFLVLTSHGYIPWFLFLAYHSAVFLLLIMICRHNTYENVFIMYIFSVMMFSCTDLILTEGIVQLLLWAFFFFNTKLVLVFPFVPTLCVFYQLKNNINFHLLAAPVVLMLVLTEVFNVTNQPIVVLQALTSTDPISAVHEGVFVGLLASQLFTAAVGMSCYESWQRGEAGLMCVGAAGSGAAVLAAMKLALPVLGPGPTVGALMGVAGAVGVSLSAAGAVADRYGHSGWVGRCGVTVGAAAAAVLSTAFHSGLSGTFMGLCAAVVPAGLYLQPMFLSVYKHNMWKNPKWFWVLLCLLIGTTLLLFLTWFHFSCTDESFSFLYIKSVLYLSINCAFLLMIPQHVRRKSFEGNPQITKC